jgi:hypothetical protein
LLTNLQCVLTEEENERGAKHPGDFSLATKENIVYYAEVRDALLKA